MYSSFEAIDLRPAPVANVTTPNAYDTVQCSIEFHGTDNFDYYQYEVHDYFSTDFVFFDATSGTFQTSVSNNLDTAFNGTEDWILVQEMSKNTCHQSYCEFSCVVSRSLNSLDSSNDTQFDKGQDLSVKSGYTVWNNRNDTIEASSGNSKGISTWKVMALIEEGAQVLNAVIWFGGALMMMNYII